MTASSVLVMIIGVTGHQRLKDPRDWEWVRHELERIVAHFPRPWVGLTSLAIGADQLFATLVLNIGCRLEVVLPNETYEESFPPGTERSAYRDLLKKASDVTILTGEHSEEKSYLEAGKRIVDKSDMLVAIWDGEPAKGLGGTGDIVAYAVKSGKQVIHIDPIARRVENK
jgi:hypothetical protein